MYNKVYFIGGGPGFINLITIQSYKILLKAEIILYDSLINNEILNISPQAIKILVGKRSNQNSIKQKYINKYINNYVKKYKLIIRLKGGDPSIFSRINEEIYSIKKNISYKILSGITTGIASANSAKVLLTKRKCLRNIFFFTSKIKNKIFYQKFIKNNILIQYMGSKQILYTIKKLLILNYSLNISIILIKNCSLYNEYIIYVKLNLIYKYNIKYYGPIIIIINNNYINN